MPRPRKQPANRRTEAIACRLTAAERAQITMGARRAGLTVSDYLRQQALVGRVVVREQRRLDHAAFDQIRRLGVNLNQLTRLAHQTGQIPPEVARAAAAVEKVLGREIDQASLRASHAGESPATHDGSVPTGSGE